MATKTRTDAGAASMEARIVRSGDTLTATITIYDTSGDHETITLSKERIVSTLTAGEITAVRGALAKLYAAALADGGWA